MDFFSNISKTVSQTIANKLDMSASSTDHQTDESESAKNVSQKKKISADGGVLLGDLSVTSPDGDINEKAITSNDTLKAPTNRRMIRKSSSGDTSGPDENSQNQTVDEVDDEVIEGEVEGLDAEKRERKESFHTEYYQKATESAKTFGSN